MKDMPIHSVNNQLLYFIHMSQEQRQDRVQGEGKVIEKSQKSNI